MTTSDIENQFQQEEFILIPKTPSLLPKTVFLFFLLIFPLALSAKTRTVRFSDQTFQLYISEDKDLFVLGPWEEGSTWIDRDVQDVWGTGAEFGVVLAYERLDEIHWSIVDRDTGEKRVGGLLRKISPEDGVVLFATVYPKVDKATIKIQFESGHFVIYLVDIHGRKKVLHEGKSDQS